MLPEILTIGKIRTSFGVKGYLKVLSFSGEMEHFLSLDSVELYLDNKKKSFKVEDVSEKNGELLMKLAGIETPEEGKRYAGWEIRVPRENAAPLRDGEYYHADLCRCSLYCNNTEIGRVLRIIEGGNGELLEIEKEDGTAVMIPFHKEFIGKIDIAKGKIELLTDWILE